MVYYKSCREAAAQNSSEAAEKNIKKMLTKAGERDILIKLAEASAELERAQEH